MSGRRKLDPRFRGGDGRFGLLAIFLLLLLAAAPAGAQAIVTSAAPDRVGVTIYRAPNRRADRPMELDWLEGYALISETRRVTIPAGTSDVRFEGVAGGILPQSAIVTGFPDGVMERNRDALLLSESTLLDRSLGRRVHLRRTSSATGAVTEQDAIIMSGADGAVVLRTPDGYEALQCTGQREMLSYDQVPPGLSARPTLSVRTRSAQPVTATITLSYLSSGFDWQANYVARLSPDGTSINLFAWLTLASMDETSFPNADTQAVAGRLNRTAPNDEDRDDDEDEDWLQLRCWPAGTTGSPEPLSTLVLTNGRTNLGDTLNELPQLRAEFAQDGDEDIVVTAMAARQENLGDLKLYRIPEPVTVAANSQKQVAFLEQPAVRVQLVYRNRLDSGDAGNQDAPKRLLVTRNRTAEGLGIPLPAGTIQLFDAAGGGRPILIGEGSIPDRAVDEDVEIEMGEATGLIAVDEETGSGRDWEDHVLTVTNDQPVPVRYEAEFDVGDGERFRPRERLGRRNGRPLWAVTVPANGSATLRYRHIEDDG
ncbi:MAG TPA: hypothetical protein VGO55_14090 [Allosphingosinicella sp.]|nr:hypothetical protein [Allosphingosinicella sp.]